MRKTLVACFSATGVTLSVAKIIAPLVAGELFRILPAQPYSREDLNWNNSASSSSVEMKNAAARPEIADKVDDMGQFEIIFLGFPIWWYDALRIILTFLDSYDFSGKTMFPFATSGGSGLGETPQNLKIACPNAKWQPGICFAGHAGSAQVEAWVKSLNV